MYCEGQTSSSFAIDHGFGELRFITIGVDNSGLHVVAFDAERYTAQVLKTISCYCDRSASVYMNGQPLTKIQYLTLCYPFNFYISFTFFNNSFTKAEHKDL